MMKSEPILLHDTLLTPDEVCLKRLIEFLGLGCRTVDSSMFHAELDRTTDHDICILANAATLATWCRISRDPAFALYKLRQKSFALFVYGFAPETPLHIAANLSDGVVSDVQRFPSANLFYKVSSARPEITREFSGLSFNCARNDADFGFAGSPGSNGMTSLVTVERMPFWVLLEREHCKTFLLATSAIADIQEHVSGNIDATRYFSRLLPPAMFLKTFYPSRCWHNKRRFANFIIDDPLLKRSYGFLNYRNLLLTMDRSSFATTIAFIPGNYRRTDKEVTQLFRERPDRLSVCVHGCDHSTAEFSTSNVAVLNSKVKTATARMDSLNRQEGLPYSTAMVFPQGRFSPEALTALKSHNYLAAVNSSASPENSAPDRSLRIADVLEPAVARYGGCPLFLRRYPVGLEQFAFDLFFDKPALVVEHHAYLKDGGERLADFIAGLNSLARLQWSGLHEIITRSYLEREVGNDIVECRLYTNDHVVENHADRERTFVISKREVDDVPIQSVFLNGQAADFATRDKVVAFTIAIPPFASAAVRIAYRNVLPAAEPERIIAGRTRAWTRRLLAEFRDNVLSRNELLLARSQALHRRFISPHRW